jgi:hypothetical protein
MINRRTSVLTFGPLAAEASEEENRRRGSAGEPPRLSTPCSFATADLRTARGCWPVSLLAANRTAAMDIFYFSGESSFGVLRAADLGVRSSLLRLTHLSSALTNSTLSPIVNLGRV